MKVGIHQVLWLVIVFLLFALYFPMFPALYKDWFEFDTNSHGVLVPFISLYLVWQSRHRIHSDSFGESKTGLLITFMSLTGYILGAIGEIAILQRVSFVTTIIGLVLYNLGYGVLKIVAFPAFFLYFMVPVPVSIIGAASFPLQMFVSDLAAAVLNGISIPTLREGNILHFSNATIEVAEACSGLRSLVAYIMLGCLFAYMTQGGYIKKLSMVIIALPLSISVNLLRVIGTGIIAIFWGSSVAFSFLHEVSGIIVFMIGFMLFLMFYMLMNKSFKGENKATST